MKNSIYRRIYKDSSKAYDGETPSEINVTEESNGYAVWETTAEEGDILVKYENGYYARQVALEKGVALYLQRKGGK